MFKAHDGRKPKDHLAVEIHPSLRSFPESVGLQGGSLRLFYLLEDPQVSLPLPRVPGALVTRPGLLSRDGFPFVGQ